MTTASKNENMREPAVAGQFYPADREELENQIDEFLSKASLEKTNGRILGLMVPHAGYQFSGQVAAFGFAQLQNENIDTVILIGNSHHVYFEGAAVYPRGYFKTPLGETSIDEELAQKIIGGNKAIQANTGPHEAEHSLEVQLPFLQRVLKNFKLVPILLGNRSGEEVQALAKTIGENIFGRNILVVASSDMSHYPPYKEAIFADKKVCQAILSGQVENLEETISQLEKENILNAATFLCAKDAVEVLMFLMQDLGAKGIKLLKYANSGDSGGSKREVVGYSAIAFYKGGSAPELGKEEQARLLEIARQSVESYVKTGRVSIFSEKSALFNQKLGAFVTLKKDNQLRGCIGCFTSDNSPPLYKTISQMAIAAATQDNRFLPVSEVELPELEYEISVLSPLKKIDDWRQIELGRHGVEIKKDGRRGVFLPQVAQETGWDLETFMGQLCFQKAGLPWNSWQDKNTELYIFTAQIFGENQ